MSGIYIHIPFCRSKCLYCNFVSVASVKYTTAYIHAVVEEIRQQQSFYLPGEIVKTIYFGGGTPSLLSSLQVETILNAVSNCFTVAHDAEITFEMNPDDAREDYLKDLKKAGINRLSIGVQSFHDEELMYLGRKHTAQTAFNTALTARNAGFDNISLDIIFGLPSSVAKDPDHNLKQLLKLNPEHISAYSLTLEERTALYHFVAQKRLPPPDDEMAASQFRFYMKNLMEAGYEQYEISNYAKPGFRSRHNSAYWQNMQYLGIGAGAHSYNLKQRFWNTSYISKYIEGILSCTPEREAEILSKNDMYNEYIITSIRRSEGIDSAHIESVFGEKYSDHFAGEIGKYVESNLIVTNHRVYALSDEGKLLADMIAEKLMM